jgi:hypothetical protein
VDDLISERVYREAIARYRGSDVDRWRDSTRSSEMWQMEAVRHLALLNSIALTGTVALFATGKYGSSLLLPLAFFFLALIALVWGMHQATVGYIERGNDYVKRIHAIDEEQEKGDFLATLEFASRTTTKASLSGERTLKRARFWAWASAALFILGATSLVSILLCTS